MKQINLTQNKIALVDDEDYEFINSYKWFAKKCKNNLFYAARQTKINGKQYTQFMHRVITNAIKGTEVDHKDHDGLNNQKYNLRVATRSQNKHNRRKLRNTSSKYKGVRYVRANYRISKPWRAEIHHNSKMIHIGLFALEVDAAKAYDSTAIKLFGEFAFLNFPKGEK